MSSMSQDYPVPGIHELINTYCTVRYVVIPEKLLLFTGLKVVHHKIHLAA
jgi:hypothetical protein